MKFSYPRGNFPRLCLLGNSNVGKSSLTKLLLSHPQWYKGKVGKTAGSTIRLTIINDPELNFHVIDLPGFGKMLHSGKNTEEYVQKEILRYIELDQKNIFLMLLIISAERLGDELEKWYFQKEDSIPLTVEFIQFFIEHEIPTVAILNKIDKLNRFQQKELIEKFRRVLNDFQIKPTGIDSETGLLEIHLTSIKENTGIVELKEIVQKRAARLDLTKFDPRQSLFDLPKLDSKAALDKIKENKEETTKEFLSDDIGMVVHKPKKKKSK